MVPVVKRMLKALADAYQSGATCFLVQKYLRTSTKVRMAAERMLKALADAYHLGATCVTRTKITCEY